jgi:hypothetical protein
MQVKPWMLTCFLAKIHGCKTYIISDARTWTGNDYTRCNDGIQIPGSRVGRYAQPGSK